MPSPFPGMDPYLEDPWLWPDVHHELISASRELLNKQLRPKYVARVEERVYLEDDDDPGWKELRIPDLRVAKRPGQEAVPSRTKPTPITEPLVVTYEPELEIREARIEILATDTRAVVTVIEFLSPSNKVKGAEGRESFLRKRREVMESKTHWVEIDFLRAGEPHPVRRRIPAHDYFVYVSPSNLRPKGHAWPIRLENELPTVGIPLSASDPDASLDLQTALCVAYERAAYDMTVNYAMEPKPPLAPAHAKWADKLLKKKRLR